MSETLFVYAAIVAGSDGVDYEARARGRERDGDWEAWLEFQPVRGGAVVRTRRETAQEDRAKVLSWAQNLSPVYLDGALRRATRVEAADAPERARAERQITDEQEGVLDPFEVYAHGQSLLRRHLDGLSSGLLRHIARAHDILDATRLGNVTREELIDAIVAEARRRTSAAEARAR